MKKYIAAAAVMLFIAGCGDDEEKPVYEPLYTINNDAPVPEFSGEDAYSFIEKQLSFGPRNPGSMGHGMALEYFKRELGKYADEVSEQSFNYTGYEGEKLHLTNVIAKFNPEAKQRIFVAAHWDTRPMADRDPDPEKQHLPIPGANDGGSGTAVILELAGIIAENRLDYGVDLILFDGEDYGRENDQANFCLGAKYFAAQNSIEYRPIFGILLDLVGDKDAVFKKEHYSVQYAEEFVNIIWNAANRIGADKFLNIEGRPIYDDHIPLNQAGIRTVNILDSDIIGNGVEHRKKYWHTHGDTMENISAETLKQVGDVVLNVLYTIKPKKESAE